MNIPVANNNLYNGEPAPPPPPPLPNLVLPLDIEQVLRRTSRDLISTVGLIEIPLATVRTTPGLYFVTTGLQELGSITEYLVYVPDQAAYPGRPEAPRNVREGIYAMMAAMARGPRDAYNAEVARGRERLAAIEADPALAFEARPAPLNVLILATRHITMQDPPETAEQMLERFLERAPAARNTQMARRMMETMYRPRAEASQRRYTTERTWRMNDRARTAASLGNFPVLENAHFFKADAAFDRRKHALAAWETARGLLNSRRQRSRRRSSKVTRRRRSSSNRL